MFDPLEHELPVELRALLESPERTLVLHGADYDVLSLRRDYDLVLGKVFDTMLAGRFLFGAQLGLKALLETELGVKIGKDEQRSDWGKRPLSAEQLEYAVRDTAHLLPLAERLEAKLREAGRLHWLEEECELLRHRAPDPRPFDPEGWRQIKGVKGLPDPGLRAARAAYLWRDEVARRQDRAPFRVLGNEIIAAVAQRVAREGADALHRLERIRGVPKGAARHSLSEALFAGLSEPLPPPPPREARRASFDRKKLDSEAKQRVSGLKALRDERARAVGLEPGFLAPNALLESMMSLDSLESERLLSLENMTRWRLEALGEAFLRALGDKVKRPR